jgi:type IX secretion system substrate protein
MKNITLSVFALLLSVSSFATIGPITGNLKVCVASADTLGDTTTGGIWTSGNTAIANVGSVTGIVTGIAAGTAIITYTVGLSYQTQSVFIKPAPSPIMTPSYVASPNYFICIPTGTITFIDTTAGGGIWNVDALAGLWFSSSANTILVDLSLMIASSGKVYFTDTGGCSTQISIVNLGPPEFYPKITGDTAIYVDSTTTLSHLISGGSWSSSNSSIATIGQNTGKVIGMSPGTTVITYFLGCYTSINFTVLPSVSVPFISSPGRDKATLFPNPTTTSLSIVSPERITSLYISNLIGQTVYNKNHETNQVQIDVAGLPKGIYLVRVNGTEVRKFVKE